MSELTENKKAKSFHLSVCIFGASGDLAKKKTYPALFHLFSDAWLSRETSFYGYGRTKMSDSEFREKLRPFLEKEAKARNTSEQINAFLEQCSYISGPYDQPEQYITLKQRMEKDESLLPGAPGRLFYLALPPEVFLTVVNQIADNCMLEETNGRWNRVVVEKPFGHDLESSEVLASGIAKRLKEDQVYRIDHYLGKELVQNLTMLRFGNTVFSAIWRKEFISSVQITFKEPFGTEGRGGYFDKSGIIRDVIQNHLLQVLAIVGMEPPRSNDPESIRDEKTKVLEATSEALLQNTVVGQYVGAGSNPGYKDDETVPKNSVTPTFATVVLFINNERWRGVPFILKAGKALNERAALIRIQWKQPHQTAIANPPANELVIRLQPDEAIYLKINTKSPGLENKIQESELDLTYKHRYDNLKIPDAYERLILDVVRGDHQHFVRRDELVAAWKIFTPLLHKLDKEQIKPIPYAYGSRGPKESDDLIAQHGYRRSESYQWKQ